MNTTLVHDQIARPFHYVAALALTLAVLTCATTGNARAEHRRALLIDNVCHDQAGSSDERAKFLSQLTRKLKNHGFQTVTVAELTQPGLMTAVESFVRSAPVNGTGFVFFTGNMSVGRTFDHRVTPVLLGIDQKDHGLAVLDLMVWLQLHSAARQHVVLIDAINAAPPHGNHGALLGIDTEQMPDRMWLGFVDFKSGIEHALRLPDQASLAMLLNEACGWTKSTGVQPALNASAGTVKSPSDQFPGHSVAGTEWVANDGSIFCYCPPTTDQDGFWMGKYEVPASKWPSPGITIAVGPRRNVPVTRQPLQDLSDRLARLTRMERQAGRLPCDWEYSLPTESEWEHAARAGTTGDQYFADAELEHHANFADRTLLHTGQDVYLYADASRDDGFADLAPVGNYQPNPWGLHDVYGNVWEVTNTGVLCGGSWVSLPGYCRADIRKPPLAHPSDYTGLRIVMRQRKPECHSEEQP